MSRAVLVVVVALGVHLELDAADDVSRSHAGLDTERHVCVADFMLVVGEIADRLGRFEELFGLAEATGRGGLGGFDETVGERACGHR